MHLYIPSTLGNLCLFQKFNQYSLPHFFWCLHETNFTITNKLEFALIYLYAKYRINNNEYNPTNTNGINDIILKILFLYLLVTQKIILNTLPTIQPSTNPLITASIISVSIIHIIPTIQIGETIEKIAISGEKNFFTLSLLPNHNSIELYVQLHNFPISQHPYKSKFVSRLNTPAY